MFREGSCWSRIEILNSVDVCLMLKGKQMDTTPFPFLWDSAAARSVQGPAASHAFSDVWISPKCSSPIFITVVCFGYLGANLSNRKPLIENLMKTKLLMELSWGRKRLPLLRIRENISCCLLLMPESLFFHSLESGSAQLLVFEMDLCVALGMFKGWSGTALLWSDTKLILGLSHHFLGKNWRYIAA